MKTLAINTTAAITNSSNTSATPPNYNVRTWLKNQFSILSSPFSLDLEINENQFLQEVIDDLSDV